MGQGAPRRLLVGLMAFGLMASSLLACSSGDDGDGRASPFGAPAAAKSDGSANNNNADNTDTDNTQVQQVPDPSQFESAFPQLATLGPPPWLQPGVRILLYQSSGTIPVERTQIVPDPTGQGRWMVLQTGQILGEQPTRGAAGAGMTAIDIAHADDQVVVAHLKAYVLDATTGVFQFGGASTGLVAHPAALADYWIHPQILRSLPNRFQGGEVIGRQTVTLRGRTFNGIRIGFATASSQSQTLYDEDTGLLVTQSTISAGGPIIVPPAGGATPGATAQIGAGSTFLTYSEFVALRQVDVPWRSQPAPPEVAGFNRVPLEGTLTIGVQDASQTTQPAVAVFERRAGTPAWVGYSTSLRVPSAPGLPPQDSTGTGASGNAMLLGLWVPPDGLAQLAPGQRLDTDPNLNAVTEVASVDDASVVITESGPAHQVAIRYDRRTGLGTDFQLSQQIGLGRSVLSLRVAG